ncbi:ABC-2 type transport system permease protein [Melghiribacillus thermohalophilus]|uniref:ABC-2 type transport system permease protein n=1 Tax=Melghiribacillus thermohalophilus TaxID=1324956 RepID=A0A4R3MST1_9BACI|nr:ABC transporter permease [Melghiribacillus thermohalophilus]TCT17536.1 ABC-2 type transport system permease protein [Melghiribacillus thermohalophilus]
MFNMLNLIRNEHMKLFKQFSTWVMVGLLVLVLLIVGIATKYLADSQTSENWKMQLQAENQQLTEQKEQVPDIGKSHDVLEERIAINQYRIDHDIPPIENKTLWGFMNSATNLTSLVTLFTIVIAAGIVAGEFSWGTIKLLLIRPVSRSKILLSKFMTTLLFALYNLFILFISSFIFGAIFFGFEGKELPYLAFVDGEVVERNMITHILTLYGLNSVDLIMMVTFAFMISTVFRNRSLAVGLSIFLMFTGQQVVMLLSEYEWVKYILFANTNLSQYMNGQPLVEGMTMTFSITVLLVYFILFVTMSWTIFQRRDVAN